MKAYLYFLLSLLSLTGLGNSLECSNISQPIFTPQYETQGEYITLAEMDTYIVGDRNASKVLLVVFDIFGLDGRGSNHTKQVCDRMSEYGYLVIMPDWFHGEPWKTTIEHNHGHLPDDPKFREFLRQTSWDESVREDMGLVLQELKAQGKSDFGIFGFCFGGAQSAYALDEYASDIKVGAMFHQAFVNIVDATRIKRPAILMPGSNDPDMTDYCTIINILNGPGSCVHRHFTDVTHGFAGATGNWSNPLVLQRAQEAVGMMEQFFCDKFPVE